MLLAALLSVLAFPAGAEEAPAPVISISAPAFVAEGNLGANDPAAAKVVFTLTLSVSSGVPITVHCATADFPYNPGYYDGFYVGDAHAGEDYVATSQTLTFAPGQITKTFSVPIMGDDAQELDLDGFPYEIFSAFLSNPVNASISEDAGSAIAGIIDDDDGLWHFDAGPAAPPTDVQAVPGAGLREITLTWTPDAHAAGYVVLCSTTAGGPYYPPYGALMLSRPQCSFVSDYGLALGTTYYYVVVAVDGEGTLSDYSNEVSAAPYEPSTPVDALIKSEGAAAYLGQDVYDDGTQQEVSQSVPAGGKATYHLRMRNTAGVGGNIVIKGSESSAGWDVKYLDASYGDVTSQVTSLGGWSSSSTSVGTDTENNFYDITLEVTDAGAPSGAQMPVLVTASFAALPWGDLLSHGDAVRAVTTRASGPQPTPTPVITPTPTPQPQPDVLIRNRGEVRDEDYVQDGIYNPQAGTQIKSRVVASGETAIYEVQIQNDSSNPAAFKVKASATGAAALVKYFNGLESTQEIAAQAMAEGWATPQLDPGKAAFIRVEVTAAPASEGAPAQDVVLSAWTAQAQEPPAPGAAGSPAVALDAVKARTQSQGIKGLQASLDGGQAWRDVVPGEVLEVPEHNVVGFRALKANTLAPWPLDPMRPQWTRGGDDFIGDNVWIHFAEPTAPGAIPEVVTARCGNQASASVHVAPETAEPEATP